MFCSSCLIREDFGPKLYKTIYFIQKAFLKKINGLVIYFTHTYLSELLKGVISGELQERLEK